MEQAEAQESQAIGPTQGNNPGAHPAPQPRAASCPTCGGLPHGPPTFIYAIGNVEARFPNLAAEKEFAQITGREKPEEMTKLPDQEVFHKVLSKRENRYLARQLCWVMTIKGIETYILVPRDPGDLDLLIEAVRPAPSPMDMDIVIGVRGPVAPPELCNGLMVPIVAFDQIYSFDRDTLIKSIPKPEKAGKEFTAAAEGLLDRIMQMADNAGATDEHRALNYLAVRYHSIYAKVAECHAANCSLTAVEVRQSRLSGTRKIVDVIFAYTNRNSDVTEKSYVRVDVTEMFPFLITKLSPYFDVS